MKLRFVAAVILFVGLLIVVNANVAHAQWSAISSGYAVTTDWHGEDTPIGTPVTATAGTTDMSVDKVEFRWLDPDGDVETTQQVSVIGPYKTPVVPDEVPQEIIDWANENPGINVFYAQDTQTPNEVGDWAAQVHFIDTDENPKSLRGRNSDIIAIRATSFNTVPEVPFGTIAILLSMLGALGTFAIRRKGSPAGMTGQ